MDLRMGMDRRRVVACAVAVVLAWVCAPVRGAEPATRATTRQAAAEPVGAISGTVTSQGEVPLSELVIYLESPDAKRQIAAPKETVKVSQKGAKFSPAIVIVCAGQTA